MNVAMLVATLGVIGVGIAALCGAACALFVTVTNTR